MRAYATNDTANVKGLNQIAEPARTRSSTSGPTPETSVIAAIEAIATAKRTDVRCAQVS